MVWDASTAFMKGYFIQHNSKLKKEIRKHDFKSDKNERIKKTPHQII